MLLWRMFCSILITEPSYTKLFKLHIYHFFKEEDEQLWTECQKMNDRKSLLSGTSCVNCFLSMLIFTLAVTGLESQSWSYNVSAVKKPFDEILKPIVYWFKILIWCWFSFSYYSHSKVNRYHQSLMKVRWKEPGCRGRNCKSKGFTNVLSHLNPKVYLVQLSHLFHLQKRKDINMERW